MHDTGSHLGTFNRLDNRPSPLLPDNPTEADLIAAFPFMFKPNRALALHPQGTSDIDPVWPSRSIHKHWMLKIQTPDTLNIPTCLITLSQYGCFALWRYDSGTASGLYPINLAHTNGSEPSNTLLLQDKNSNEFRPAEITLIHITQNTDEDNLTHNIRIETTRSIFKVEWELIQCLDNHVPDKPITYWQTQHEQRQKTLSNPCQIGGWQDGKQFHWDSEKCELIEGSPKRPSQIHPFPFRVRAAQRDGDNLVVGGESTQIHMLENTQLKNTCQLKSHLYSLAIASTQDSRYILAGCADHNLYILDWDGHILQKVMMNGIVEGIVWLKHDSDQWIDVAVCVRNKGLLCARLFIDCLQQREPFINDRAIFQHAVANLLSPNPDPTLQHWFSSTQHREQQSLVFTLMLTHPLNPHVATFLSRPEILKNIGYSAMEFWVHILHRAILHTIKQDTDWWPSDLLIYLNLLRNIANGPERARITIRKLEGWLLSLFIEQKWPSDVQQAIEALHQSLPDAKRSLRSLALKIDQANDDNNLNQNLGLYLSTYNRIRFDQYFTELILGGGDKTGPVSAVAMIGKLGKGQVALIRVHRDDHRLRAFYLNATDATIRPRIDEENWRHSLSEHQPVQRLLPIGESRVLIIAEYRIGIAVKGKSTVQWHEQHFTQLLRSAAILDTPKSDSESITVAIGSIGSPESALVYLFEIQGQTFTLKGSLHGKNLEPENIIQDLAWDQDGNLLAVTTCHGLLLQWSHPLTTSPKPTILKKFNASQYALIIHQNLIICGGEEGVIRAFHPSGTLAWNFITRGAVQSLQALPIETQSASDSAPIVAAISEHEHLYTLDKNGQQHGLLFMPQRHLRVLAARALQPGGQVHYLVGTLEGEVRLIETIPTRWSHTRYLEVDDKSFDADLSWPQISQNLDEKINALQHAQLRDWCLKAAAMEEPMRYAWAACQLIKHHNNIDSVLTMLTAFTENFDPDIVKLRAHIFALLAPKLGQLTQEQIQAAQSLCQEARDGTFASLVMRLTSDDFSLVHSILIEKLMSGAPFTSAALLHVLRNPGWRQPLENVLIELMKQPSLLTLHRGLLSGLLGIFFQKLRVGRPHKLISLLAHISHIFPAFGRHLLSEDFRYHHQFCQWLNQYGPRIFSLEDQTAWTTLSPFLSETDPTQVSTEKFLKIIVCQDPQDNQTAIWAIIDDIRQDIGKLPTAWKTWQALENTLIATQHKISQKQLTAVLIRQTIKQTRHLIQTFEADIPLFAPLQLLWKHVIEQNLNAAEKAHDNQPKTHYLKLTHETLWVVEGEPAPLTLRVNNQGPEDLTEQVCLGLENTALSLIQRNTATKVTCGQLACPKESPLGETLELKVFLLPPFDLKIALDVFWSVGKTFHHETLQIDTVPRWTQYQKLFPTRDQLAYRLCSLKTHNAFKYHRVIIKRTAYIETNFVNRHTMTAMIYDWAERTGRRNELNLLTPEPSWPGAKPFAKDLWAEKLREPPAGFEVWVVEEAINWSLRFLNILVQSPDTALFLPDLVVEDTQQPENLFQLLDQLLYLHEDNQLNTLQWALKACTQSVRDILPQGRSTLPPTFLGRNVQQQDKQITPRGEIPTLNVWQTMKNGWPIAGVVGPRDDAALPPDPTKPLCALVPASAFQYLFRMGLITHWNEYYWAPKTKVLFDYTDSVYPTRTAGNSLRHAKSGAPWGWVGTDWSKKALQAARNLLFGKRQRPPMYPPYEGFSFDEWESLRDYAKAQTLPDGFFQLIGLTGRNAYNQLSSNQMQWSKSMQGDASGQALLLKRLQEGRILLKEQQVPSIPCRLIWLTVEGLLNRFRRMLLILPKTEFFHIWQTEKYNKTRSIASLLEKIHEQVKVNDAITLVVYEWPTERRHEGALEHREIAFLNARHINRLMVCDAPAETLVSIAKSQISLSSLSQSVFQTKGAVSPNRFFGRTSELQQLTSGLLAEKSFVITGPRSIGKSSLLRFFPKSSYWASRLKNRFFLISLDLQNQRTGLSYGSFLYALLTQLPNPPNHLIEQMQAMRKRRTSAAIQTSPAWRHDMTDLAERVFEAIFHYAQDRRPLFLLDEADGFYQHDKAANEPLFTLFRQYQAEGRAQFIFASYPEKADSLAKELVYSGNQSFNFLEMITLETLKASEARRLVQNGMDEIGIPCNAEQCKGIVEKTFSIPSLTQQTCHNLCLALEQQIAEGDDETLQQTLIDRVILESQRSFLDIFFAQLRPQAVKFALVGLVLEGKHRFTQQEAIDAFKMHAGFGSKETIIEQLQSLLRTLILSYHHGKYVFSGKETPYFPTMAMNVYGKDELENQILQQMEDI